MHHGDLLDLLNPSLMRPARFCIAYKIEPYTIYSYVTQGIRNFSSIYIFNIFHTILHKSLNWSKSGKAPWKENSNYRILNTGTRSDTYTIVFINLNTGWDLSTMQLHKHRVMKQQNRVKDEFKKRTINSESEQTQITLPDKTFTSPQFMQKANGNKYINKIKTERQREQNWPEGKLRSVCGRIRNPQTRTSQPGESEWVSKNNPTVQYGSCYVTMALVTARHRPCLYTRQPHIAITTHAFFVSFLIIIINY